MRLDLFLKASRLCLRRTIAQQLCEAGQVHVNDVRAKASRTVQVGDEIAVRRRNRLLIVRVLAVPATRQTSRSDASGLYEILSDKEIPAESLP
ncbi:MAG TPA: RNA-binding S4 domain-containing protein [Pyrinomonadaceae bacterium]|jgi:ribosomal 50S subunit-recycling heat shock protein